MLKAVVFDFDGVIADTFGMCMAIHRENNRNISTAEYRNLHNGNIYDSEIRKFTEEETRKFWQCYREKISKKHLFPVAGQIKELAKEHQLFIVSSSIESVIGEFLSLTKLARYFAEILGADTHKSKIEKFKMIFQKYGLTPEECVFVTDTLGDLQEGKKVGVPTVAVTWGYHGKTRLKKGKPHLMIHDFHGLKGAIRALNRP